MEILAIIPARANSKGIPDKNIIPVAGKPLIAWNIEAALKSNFITRVVVSTDGEKISQIALEYGAEVIRRPDELSGDTASSESALLHVLETLKAKEKYTPQIIVFLQCTSPLTSTEDIDKGIEKFISEKADSATTVTDFHYFIWKETEGNAEGINHNKKFRPRRQDREPQYIETGAVYIMNTEGFLKNKHRFFGKTILVPMPPERVKEIDEPADLPIVEAMFKNLIRKNSIKQLPENIDLVIFDFDGVMTDDSVIVDENGKEAVICSRGDGMGISMLKKAGIKTIVLSTEVNPVVSARCKKLKIECYQGLGNSKQEAMEKYLSDHSISPENVVYMGNDVNDIECMEIAGCAVAPSNAIETVKNIAQIVLNKAGGNGAVRDLCDLIIQKTEIK